jgi:predicted transcriptional regulator of viral defense system
MRTPAQPPYRRIADIATTAELLARGVSAGQIRTRVRRGELLAIGRGAYASGTRARELLSLTGGAQLLQVAAAAAVIGPESVVSHESAAFLHNIDLLGTRTAQVTLTCPPQRGWRGPTGVRLHAADLPPAHVTSDATGLRLTTPARTVVDLARTLTFRAGVVAADSALHRKLATKDELRSIVADCRRRSGIGQAEAVVEFADALAESPLESIARVVFRDCGLPPPALQAWLGGTTDPVGRVDFYWQKYRTVAEVDGAIKYADPLRAQAQIRRDSLLRADGFEVVHFDWHDITENPAHVAASIRTAFRRAVRLQAGPGATG